MTNSSEFGHFAALEVGRDWGENWNGQGEKILSWKFIRFTIKWIMNEAD